MRVLNVQRMSTEDGPGLRTTVFLKGCPLACAWCHNPESIPAAFGKEWIRQNCIRCGTCEATCPQRAVTLTETGVEIDVALCDSCLACVEHCPADAMRPLGRDVSWEDLFRELVRDRAYYGAAGGVTLSGGEVLMQADEAVRLAGALREAGIGVAIDTAGFAPWRTLERFLPCTDLFLYDLKLADDARHECLCGVGNELIKANLKRLAAAGAELWIRTPVIPGATDDEANIRGIAAYLREAGIAFSRWELCAFNNLAKDKYARLGRDWAFRDAALMTVETMDRLVGAAKAVLGDGSPVLWTGMTRGERA